MTRAKHWPVFGPLWVPLAALVVLAAACDGGVAAPTLTAVPPKAHSAQPGAQEGKPLADKEGGKVTQTFTYRAAGRRDPFRSYLLDAVSRRAAEHAQRRVEETEAYELSQYHLTGVLTGTSQPKAMVEDPTGKAFVLRIGARLGRAGGRVSRIDSTGLQVLEDSLDPQGMRLQVPVSLLLPVPNSDDPALGLGATP